MTCAFWVLVAFWLGLAVGFGGLLGLYILREARHGR